MFAVSLTPEAWQEPQHLEQQLLLCVECVGAHHARGPAFSSRLDFDDEISHGLPETRIERISTVGDIG